MKKSVLFLNRHEFDFLTLILDKIFDRVDTGFILVDRKQIIKSVNSAFVCLSGWKRDDLKEKNIFEFLKFHEESSKVEVRKKDGEVILVFVKKIFLKELSGNFWGEILLLDATEAVFLRRIRELENILLFVRGAVHDFNNLFTIISMNFEILEGYFSNDLKARSTFEKIRKAILKIWDILKRVSSLYQKTVEEVFSIKDLIKETVDLILNGFDVDYRLILNEDVPDIIGDRIQIFRMIQNLLINAREAIEDDKRLLIRVSVVEKEKEGMDYDKWVKIEIEDWGCGIDKRYISRIFEPEFTTKKKGKGLGLAVSRRIVERHGGFIEVLPKEKGTIFIVYLPVKA